MRCTYVLGLFFIKKYNKMTRLQKLEKVAEINKARKTVYIGNHKFNIGNCTCYYNIDRDVIINQRYYNKTGELVVSKSLTYKIPLGITPKRETKTDNGNVFIRLDVCLIIELSTVNPKLLRTDINHH